MSIRTRGVSNYHPLIITCNFKRPYMNTLLTQPEQTYLKARKTSIAVEYLSSSYQEMELESVEAGSLGYFSLLVLTIKLVSVREHLSSLGFDLAGRLH